MASNPRIGFAPLDSADRVRRDAESFGDLFVGSGARSNLSNLFVGEGPSSMFGVKAEREGVFGILSHSQELKVLEPVVGLLPVDMVDCEIVGVRPVEGEPNETVNENPISHSVDHERRSMIGRFLARGLNGFELSLDLFRRSRSSVSFDDSEIKNTKAARHESLLHAFKGCCFGFHADSIV